MQQQNSVIFIDLHADIPNPFEVDDHQASIDTATPIQIDHLIAGKVGAIVLSASVVRSAATPEGVAADKAVLDAKIAAIRDIAARHPDKAVFAKSARDIAGAAAAGKVAILLSLLGVHGWGTDGSEIDRFFEAGGRILGLTHIGNTAFADSSRPYAGDVVHEHGGLSALGRQAVARANQLGIVVDVSQLSTDALQQAVSLSNAPVIASHSGARALVDSPRNLSDDELRAVAARGGVIGIVAFNAYLRVLTDGEIAARAEVTARFGGMQNGYAGVSVEQRNAFYAALTAATHRATLDDYLATIDYVVGRVGVDHVALASDFNQGGGLVGWDDASETPNLVSALRAHGYDEDAVRKICGGNFLRVLAQVEHSAANPSEQES